MSKMPKSPSRRRIKALRRLWIWGRPFLKYLAFGFFAFIILLIISGTEAWLKEQSQLVRNTLDGLEGSAIAGQIEGISIIIAVFIVFIESRKRSHYEAHQVVDSAKGSRTSFARIQALEDLARDGQSLRGLDVEPEANLQEINLTAADLRSAQFKEADLTKAKLWEANLERADLTGAELQEADLTGANLSDAVLQGAVLVGAILFEATLKGTNLSNSHLGGADLRGADLTLTNFQGAHLGGTRFAGADLKGANFDGVTIANIDEIKLAQNWQDPSTRYSETLSKRLGLRPKS
jgi:uncharacterized protein YjbI with pentapeptide repeats